LKKGVIIGAGIGGLTTAIALAQQGIQTAIYEQARELNDIGAGIWVAPNGLKVFDKLGLATQIIDSGKVLDQIRIVDLNQNIISTIDSQKIKARHKFQTVAIHRASLQKILRTKLGEGNIVLGKRFKAYSQSENTVTVKFEDGTLVASDFLILADGINSNGRLQLNKALNLRYSGQTCWRFVTEFEYPKSENGNMYEIWSNKKGLRVGYSQINEKEIYVFITNYEKAGNLDNLFSLKQDLLLLCNAFPEIVKHLISKVEEAKIIRTDLFDFKPNSNWVDRNVALLGDAAHATTPNLGQGACQAIEDAYVIAEELASLKSIEQGLRDYQSKRIVKAKYITNTSWKFAQITNTSGIVKSFVKAILRMIPDSVNEKQLDKIYALE
jgi:2-polyprenyl-6-methoxyphenol hydroxylase-like FAD-dependent oxidoreductase